MENISYIYSLSDPDNNYVRYVGKTNFINRRLRQHIIEAGQKSKSNNHKSKWINSILRENRTPIIDVIDIIPESEWKFWERHYISLYRSWGFKLTNSCDGGEGSENPSSEVRFRIGSANRGKKLSDETKRKLSERFKGRIVSQETKDKRKETLKGKPHFNIGRKKSEKTIEKIRISSTGRIKSEATRKKLSESMFKRIKRDGYMNSPETRKKISKSQSGKKASAETKLKLSKIRKGRKLTDRAKENIKKSLTGRKRSERERESIRLSWIKRKEKYGKYPYCENPDNYKRIDLERTIKFWKDNCRALNKKEMAIRLDISYPNFVNIISSFRKEHSFDKYGEQQKTEFTVG